MADNNTENANSQNGDTEAAGDSQEHQQQGEQFTAREKQYYERFKKSEQKRKDAEAKLAALQASQTSDDDGDADEQPAQAARTTSEQLNPEDVYTLIEAGVPRQDIDLVKRTARILNVSIAEALEDEDLKTLLKSRAERRKVADAVNTKTAKQSVKKVSDTELVQQAAKGNIPKPGTEEAEALFWARRGGKRA